MSLIALGVTGGIGAYKAVEIARGLQKREHELFAVMTRNACRFLGPLTLEAITRHRVITDQFERGANADIEHIALASRIELLLVAPATANIIGKFANGIADDFLSSLYLATEARVLLAPAMNTHMLEHPAVRRNVETLAARGVCFVEPGAGYLACGWIGKGRLADVEEIVEAAEQILRPASSLRGRRVVVSAGPTFEDIDPVRYIGNRSSGRMGFAVAKEAARRGASVVLVAGPTTLEPPPVTELVRVRSAAEMLSAVTSRAEDADVIVMAAAVADYTPERPQAEKMVKRAEDLTLTLRPTTDILGQLGRWRAGRGARRPILVGFAAETSDLLGRARTKRRTKGLDLIVANDVTHPEAGFEVDTNAVTIISEAGEEPLPLQPKTRIAVVLLDRIEALVAGAVSRAE